MPVGVDNSPSSESLPIETYIFLLFNNSKTAGVGTDSFPCSVWTKPLPNFGHYKKPFWF